jgi:predicted RNA-binding Zn ribbon-like protein
LVVRFVTADQASSEPPAPRTAANVALQGGRLCLDFVNTIDPRFGPRRNDLLGGYDDLVAWAEHAEAISRQQARALRREGSARLEDTAAVFRAAIDLREALYRMFAVPPEAGAFEPTDLATLNRALAAALPHRQIVESNGGFDWDWEPVSPALDRVLWPVTLSAAELVTSAERARVRECPGEHCGWLFLDASKNRSRRWCSMESCGSQEKSRRYYQRHRSRA